MWPYEQDIRGHANIQHNIMHRYSCMNLARFGFLDFYIEKYYENDNMVKYSRYICSQVF
jgi:hypothetical protein